MESQDSQIDSLHQKASAHYLQGEFHQALEAWRELLALDPQDERAIEGVKLCELLAEDGSSTAAPAAEPEDATAAPASAMERGPVEGFDEDLDELDAILDGKAAATAPEAPAPSFDFEFSDSEDAVDRPPKAALDGPERQTEGIDFGDTSQEEPIALGDGAEQQGVQFAVDPQLLDLPQGDGEAQSAEPGDAAAAELRHRVEELMAEAHACLEKKDRNGALSALNRVAILDENNEEAQALRQRIEEEDAQPEPAAPPEEPPAFDLQVPDDPAPSMEEPVPPVEQPIATVEPEPELEPGHEPSEAVAESMPEPGPEPSVELAVGIPKSSLRDRLSGMNLLIAGGVLAVIAIGGISALWFLGGPGAGGDAAAPEDGAVAEAGAGALPQLPTLPGKQEPADASQEAQSEAEAEDNSPEKEIDVTVLMAKAEKAFDVEDYGEAVLAYNQVLEADPDNSLAKAQLAIAGERYREQKKMEENRAEAIAAFDRGNYRAALTIFYRMPESEDQRKLDRYKLNGWYNMGVQALSMGDCESANTHLQEAQAIDPADKEVIIALDLARICKYSRGDRAFVEEVSHLTYRALED